MDKSKLAWKHCLVAAFFVFVGMMVAPEEASACCDYGSGCHDDCPSFLPVCDPGQDTCHVCIGSSQEVCTNVGLVCGSGRFCIECNGNNDCPGTQLCKNAGTASSECVDCLDDNQCTGNTPICGNNNTCRGCQSDNECFNKNPGDPVCDGGPCVECTSDAHCASGEYCSGNSCQICGCDQWCNLNSLCYDDFTCELECFADSCT